MDYKLTATRARFNRYIVECKSVQSIIGADEYTRFNRYIVECKWSLSTAENLVAVWI